MGEHVFEIDNSSLYRKLCGTRDRNLKIAESVFGMSIIPRGNTLIFKGDDASAEKSLLLFHTLSDVLHGKDAAFELDEFDIRYFASMIAAGKAVRAADLNCLKITVPESGRSVSPKTVTQAEYLASIAEKTVTFGIGPAGTGKTYLAVASAVQHLTTGAVDRIVLTRPAVEAGESLGFLPGDLSEKINPYLRPLYDALFDLLPVERVSRLIEHGAIEIAPLAYMRGRTLSRSFIILDEAQNTTMSQMKMFLTRLGNQSKFVISGDVTQIDIDKPEKSGLVHALKILQNIEEIGFVRFTMNDICRHPIVQKIVSAYENQ